jgi:hypothetical protein
MTLTVGVKIFVLENLVECKNADDLFEKLGI